MSFEKYFTQYEQFDPPPIIPNDDEETSLQDEEDEDQFSYLEQLGNLDNAFFQFLNFKNGDEQSTDFRKYFQQPESSQNQSSQTGETSGSNSLNGNQENVTTPKSMDSTGTFSNKNDFINTLNATYQKVLKQKGLDPEYSYVLTASAVMESGWGTKISGSFNYGGVKAGKNTKGSVKYTTDYENGQYIRRQQKFRDFNSVEDYCNYVVNLLSGQKYYKNAFSKFSASQPLQFWRYVLDSGYGGGDDANKSKYVDDVRKIINTIKSNVKQTNPEQTNNQKQTNGKSSYPTPERKVDVNNPLIRIDLEDLLKQEGITSVNGKGIKFGRKGLRPRGVSYGVKNSWHYVLDQYTGNASARDISIYGGTIKDYADLRTLLLNNKRVCEWMKAKGWGIINEITDAAKRKTNATGNHFHFGPDKWARRTWNAWVLDPTIPVTKIV